MEKGNMSFSKIEFGVRHSRAIDDNKKLRKIIVQSNIPAHIYKHCFVLALSQFLPRVLSCPFLRVFDPTTCLTIPHPFGGTNVRVHECHIRCNMVELPRPCSLLLALTAFGLLVLAWDVAVQVPRTPCQKIKESEAEAEDFKLPTENEYRKWLDTFAAADPAFQDYCAKAIRGIRVPGVGSQFSQDIFLFDNIFKYWPMRQRRGYYVESGSNDPVSISTSLFFDKCLGWTGLCVEPQPRYHQVRVRVLCVCVGATSPWLLVAELFCLAHVHFVCLPPNPPRL
jgi:hypothetical protein